MITSNNNTLNPQQQAALKALLIKTGNAELVETLRTNNSGLISSACDEALNKFITEDPIMLNLKVKIKKVFDRSEPVMILGETGTGKELIAHALHGGRRGAFRAINVTSLPDDLIESELFGHVAGAFTGAISSKEGLMEAARDGTLFLDEIGNMPLTAQAKLLRALQERTIRRVGDVKEMAITCRIVCATHCDLEAMVASKLFREDLYWRLRPIQLKTTPLRARVNDIYELLHKLYDCEMEIPEEVTGQWTKQELRGNVRELQARALAYKLFREEI